jgi:putative transposase
MPIVKVYLHFVWTTKERMPFLYHMDIRKKVWQHMTEYAKSKNIQVIEVNGHSDHCHCLVLLSNTQRICDIAQYIKGESSSWINKAGIIKDYFMSENFDWQDDYYVESVSPFHLKTVINYIENQEEHHLNQNLDDELKQFLKNTE